MVVQPRSSNGPLLAQAFPFQLDAVGVVDEPVQDGVGQRRVAEYFMMPSLLTGWSVALEQPGW